MGEAGGLLLLTVLPPLFAVHSRGKRGCGSVVLAFPS